MAFSIIRGNIKYHFQDHKLLINTRTISRPLIPNYLESAAWIILGNSALFEIIIALVSLNFKPVNAVISVYSFENDTIFIHKKSYKNVF